MRGDALLAGLKSADRQEQRHAFEALYGQYYGSVAAWVNTQSGTDEDAQDVFQESLLVLFRSVQNGKFREAASVKTYLFAIARRLWFKRLEQQRRMRVYRAEEQGQEAEIDSLEEELEAHARLLVMREQLEQLDTNCRELLLLFYFQRTKMKVIMERYGLGSEQAAKNKKMRCLQKLRELCRAALSHDQR